MGAIVDGDLEFKTPRGFGIIYKYEFEGKVYIGQTRKDLKVRHRGHMHGRCGSIPADNIISKHELKPEIIAIAPICWLNALEMHFISMYNSIYPNGWNFTTGGAICLEISRGMKHFNTICVMSSS